jgi:hypothetical protein
MVKIDKLPRKRLVNRAMGEESMGGVVGFGGMLSSPRPNTSDLDEPGVYGKILALALEDHMEPCDSCVQLDHELTEVKEALRALDRSEARGYEYSEEHQRLERRRELLLEQLSIHQASHSKSA